MSPDLDTISWPASRLGELIEALARASLLTAKPERVPEPPATLVLQGGEGSGKWIEEATRWLGLEAEPVEVSYAEVESFLRSASPVILQLPGSQVLTSEPRFLGLLGCRESALVLGPDLRNHPLPVETIRAALCHEVETPLLEKTDKTLQVAGVSKRGWQKARAAILRECLRPVRISGCWLLGLPPGASFWTQLRRARLARPLFTLAGAHAIQYFLWIVSWWLVGKGELEGRLDVAWLWAWALLLFTLVPLQLLTTWLQGRFAVGAGALLKRRLLYGSLRLEPDEIRHEGAGQLMGRVIESEAVESLALSGGFLALVALIELVMACIVLSITPAGRVPVLLLIASFAAVLFLGWRYFRRREGWTSSRLGLTHDLIESMVGHRTRLAQQPPERWHDGEDQAYDRYFEKAVAMDRLATPLMALAPQGWLVVGLAGLAPAFVAGEGSVSALAITLGGVLLAFRSFKRLTAGISDVVGAAIAWRQVEPVFRAGDRPEVAGGAGLFLPSRHASSPTSDGRPVIEVHDLVFRYPGREEPVLSGCSLQIHHGERVLLEGPSGGGKSTFASVLGGLRLPQSGLLLAEGLDLQSLGLDAWRKRVVVAPQFHENHVLTGTLAFNLLMGRHWPAYPEELAEAEAVCRELGLGELLTRMPAGLLQTVGETGWQLSHGERSRLYIARALLEGSEVVVLDESFAHLDPENLRQALACVFQRASSLVVIAHP